MIKDIQPQDLIKYGLIPEFVGRLPIVVGLDELTEDALVNIMTEPKNSIIKQYIKLFKMDDVELSFADEVLDFIVDKSIEFKLGARGLRSIVETIMMDLMFEIPSTENKTLKVELDYARERVNKMNHSA
jgi:ATP-dependent Clp protease ATP-binding subunit ClpX